MLCSASYNLFKDLLIHAPYNYLEIGVFDGDGIAKLAKAFPDKQFYGVDPFIEDGCTACHTNVARGTVMQTQRDTAFRLTGKLDNVTLFEATSRAFAESLTDERIELLNVGWVLIDGSHDYADVMIDYKLALRLIGTKRGGIVFDDLDIPEVQNAYKQFLKSDDENISFGISLTRSYPSSVMFHPINHKQGGSR